MQKQPFIRLKEWPSYKVRAKRTDYAHQNEHLTLLINDVSNEAINKLFESDDRCANVHYQLQKPFERLAKMKGISDWRRG